MMSKNTTSLEIERKFLVCESFPRDPDPLKITQGYLPNVGGNELRIRCENDQFFLTRKERITTETAYETTCVLPEEIGREMMRLCSGGTLIQKRRHQIHVNGYLWEIDEYLDANAGLVVAEIELSCSGQKFEMPSWIDDEVTHDPDYKNAALFRGSYANMQTSMLHRMGQCNG